MNLSLPDFPAVDDALCCMGAAVYGPERCTCWRPEYDLEQADPRPDTLAGAMPRMCGDCAFRPGSPERTNSDGVVADAETLEACVTTGQSFWCHNGLRRVVAYVHEPTGTRWEPPGADAAFTPPIIDGQPYKADGNRGDLCAGYVARRLAHLYRGTS